MKIIFSVLILSLTNIAFAQTKEFNCGGVGFQIREKIIGGTDAKFGGIDLKLCSKMGVFHDFRDSCDNKATWIFLFDTISYRLTYRSAGREGSQYEKCEKR